MDICAEIVVDNVGPNNKRIITFDCNIPLSMLSFLLEYKELSITHSHDDNKVIEQVETDPFVPIKFLKQHKDSQSIEFFPMETHGHSGGSHCDLVSVWRISMSYAVIQAKRLIQFGVAVPLVNKMLEPWTMTRCIITATEWDTVFKSLHPCHYKEKKIGIGGMIFDKTNDVVWETELNPCFPTEIHTQQLAIEMKKAMDKSEPTKLEECEWHFPFITEEDTIKYLELHRTYEGIVDTFTKLSASRCTYSTNSYNIDNIENELLFADAMLEVNHLIPFEHQAMATRCSGGSFNLADPDSGEPSVGDLPKGIEMRISSEEDPPPYVGDTATYNYWSRNFQGWVQARTTLDGK